MMFGSAESERPTLTNREIIFEEFQPSLCDHSPPTSQTDERTDDIWSQDRALHCSASRCKNPTTEFFPKRKLE